MADALATALVAAGPRVFITGASSGIGAALAARYARDGATLGLFARRESALRELAASLSPAVPTSAPGLSRHRVYPGDVCDHAALAAAARDFIAHAGGIDIVIANAGISHGTLTEVPEDLPVFEAIIATNVTATVATFGPFIEAMREQGHGTLVGMASVAGVRGLPGGGGYSASKAAVVTYCEALRLEMRRHGIRVVTIAPGYIDTPMTRQNKYHMPFLMAPERFADRAVRAIGHGVRYRVIPWQMGVVAKLLRWLPDPLYDLAFARAPRKARKSAP
ncbi:SDR family oxidoreductase [Pseudoduganella albidiflava]|uniref:SDR family oxidoreductase n=1 Tax=Pseudoduganella albidiflava TaxID=321983 RepID=A0A411X3R1_9BURK|nr:SDR family oxidoreductase [Pseudoduganella albidiflava]QBI03666.1 SDR family oxidoreductase [Pseudoduganella albidiflava]GGY51836.1 short-chain dehydrogenase [Pseudoduganella albidiflava]